MDRPGPKTSFSGSVDLNLQGLACRKFWMLAHGSDQEPEPQVPCLGRRGLWPPWMSASSPAPCSSSEKGKLVSQNKSHRSCLTHHLQPPAESCSNVWWWVWKTPDPSPLPMVAEHSQQPHVSGHCPPRSPRCLIKGWCCCTNQAELKKTKSSHRYDKAVVISSSFCNETNLIPFQPFPQHCRIS